ncbi:hypothetical protein QTP88_003684 [Uroleucon formosanum]
MWKEKDTTTLELLVSNMNRSYKEMEVTRPDIFGNISCLGRRRSKASQVVSKRKPCQNIGTWNVRTMLNTGKLENIKVEMTRLNIDILGVSERTGRAGVGVIINKKWGQQVINKIAYNDRLIMVKAKAEPSDIVIIQVYFPTTEAEDNEIEDMYAGLEELCKLTKGSDNLIIIGDWNAVVGEGADGQVVGAYGLGTRNERGDRLIDYCKQYDLVITNTYQNIHRRKRYTWKMPGDIGRYQIDYILVRKRFRNQVRRCKTYPGADVDSDHNLLMMKSNVTYKKLNKPTQKERRYDVNMLKDRNTALAYESCISKTFKAPSQNDSLNIRWEAIKETIHNAANKTLIRNTLDPKKPWINEQILRDIEERRKYKNSKDNQGIRKYKELKNKINRNAKEAREKWLEDRCHEVELLIKENKMDQAFNTIKKFVSNKTKVNNKIRDENGNLLIDNEDIANRWKQYLEVLYQGEEITSLHNESNPDNEGAPILREEFNQVLKMMKTRKSPGVDNISTELIQNAGKKIQNELFKLVNDIYITGEIPEDFKKNIIITLPKKATAEKCSEYRTPSLMIHSAKILVKIIGNRIEHKIERQLSNDQFGFRRNKGTREAILSLRTLIEKQIEFNNDTFIAFIDLEKAFDTVPWKELFKTLEEIDIDYRDRQLIYNIYKEQLAIIKVSDKSATAKIGKGVKQGCPLSPKLFNIYVEQSINEIKETFTRDQIEVTVGGELISFLRFADDIALVANSEIDLKRALEKIAKGFQNYHLKINWNKTKIMMCQKKNRIHRLRIKIDNHILDQVENFRYLGSIISQDGKCTMDIKARIAQAKTAFMNKRNLLCSKNMSIRVKKRLIKVYVWSVALYGCETWVLNKAEQKFLESFEMWCWRRMLRVSWVERRTNENVLNEINETWKILSTIKERRCNMIGHVLRHEEELLYIIIEGKMNGKRDRGRPRTSCIKKMISDAGLANYKELKRLAENRDEWRNFGKLQNQP